MRTVTQLCLSLALLAGTSSGQRTFPEFDRADEETVRLLPGAFADLSSSVQEELKRRGCTIPQVYPGVERSNIVRGRFTAPDQIDVAVLCSRQRVSSILIFQEESTAVVAELASAPDRNYLQGIGGGVIGFSRALGVASPRYIQEHYEAFGGPEPPPLDHDGVNDAFVGKASVVWYWYEGQWLQLTGAD